MIELDEAAAFAGVKAIRDATLEFDEVAANKSPDSLDAGTAQVMLADVLATAADVAFGLVYELDTLAGYADEGI